MTPQRSQTTQNQFNPDIILHNTILSLQEHGLIIADTQGTTTSTLNPKAHRALSYIHILYINMKVKGYLLSYYTELLSNQGEKVNLYLIMVPLRKKY